MSARGHPAALSKKGQAMWPEAGERRLQTLPEQIAERIYAAIVAGEFVPGERIREEALTEVFQVSRGPICEALHILDTAVTSATSTIRAFCSSPAGTRT